MEPAPRPQLEPAGAGALLVAATAIAAGTGALIGWALGRIEIGVVGGVLIGIPAGILVVYRRYKSFFS
jgi:F0F1-type ATP synthase assembly protein I